MLGQQPQQAHAAGITYLKWLREQNVLVSMSLDSTMKIWKLDQNQRSPIATYQFPAPIYCADIKYPMCVVGTAKPKPILFSLITLR